MALTTITAIKGLTEKSLVIGAIAILSYPLKKWDETSLIETLGKCINPLIIVWLILPLSIGLFLLLNNIS